MALGPDLSAFEQGRHDIEVMLGGLGQERSHGARRGQQGDGAPGLGPVGGVPGGPQQGLDIARSVGGRIPDDGAQSLKDPGCGEKSVRLGAQRLPIQGPGEACGLLGVGQQGQERGVGTEARPGPDGGIGDGNPGGAELTGLGRTSAGGCSLRDLAQPAAQSAQVHDGQPHQRTGEKGHGGVAMRRFAAPAELVPDGGAHDVQERSRGRFRSQQHRGCAGGQGHTSSAQIPGECLGVGGAANDDRHLGPGGAVVDVLEPERPGDVGVLLPGGGGQDHLDTGRRLRALSVGCTGGRPRRGTGNQCRPPMGRRAGHRDPGALVGDHRRDGRVASVTGGQPQAGGSEPRAVLGGDEQAGRAATEGLHGDVGVPQHHDLRPMPVGVRGRQGGQKPGGGGRAVLIVVHEDEVRDGAGDGDGVGVPRTQGFHGSVLEASRVHLAGLGPALSAGPALRVPGAQELGGGPPDGDIEPASEVGQLIGVDAELSGARQEVAQLGAECPRPGCLSGEPGPDDGTDHRGQNGVLLCAGQKNRGWQGGGPHGQGGGQDRQSEGCGSAHSYDAVTMALTQQVGGPATQPVSPRTSGCEQDGIPAACDRLGQQPKGQRGLTGPGSPQDDHVGALGHAVQDPLSIGVGGGQLRRLGGRKETDGVLGHGTISPRATDRSAHR